MAVVRQYGLPEQEARGVQNPYPQVPAAGDLASFGGGQARDLQQAGANLERTADTTFGIFERAAKDANDLKVDSDANSFIEQKQKTLVGFSQLKGQDAIAGADAVTKSLLEQKKQLLEGATNDYQRNALSRRLDAHLLDATGSITQHVAREAQNMRVATTKAEANLIDREAFAKQDDPAAIEALLGVKAANANKQAAEAGHGPDTPVAREMVAREQSELLTTIVQAKIVTGDPSALTFYDKYKDRIDPAKRPALDAAVKTMRIGIEARGWVASNGATGGSADNNIGNITTSNFQYAGGKGAPKGAFETFQTPEHGVAAAYQLITTKARANGGAISFIDLIGGNDKVKGWAAADDGKDPMLKGNNPRAYALRLAQSVGLQPGDMVPLGDDARMAVILKAMNLHEKGKQTVGEEAYAGGIRLAKGGGAAPGRPGPVATPSAATGDPALDAVNAATGAGTAAGAAAASAANNADGIVDARRRMIEIEQRRVDLTNKAMSEITDLDLQRATLNAIEADYTRRKAGVQLYKDELYANVQDWMTKGGPDGRGNPTGGPALKPPPANIMSQLTWEQQQSIERQVQRNIEGKKPVTNRNVWYELHKGLTSENANVREMWAAAPLTQYSEFLSESDFQELAKLQAAVRKGEGKELTRVQTNNALVNSTLLTMGVDTTPKPGSSDATKAATFHRVFQDELTLFEAQKGKPATPQEAQKIIDGMVKKVTTEGWLWAGETPAVFVTKVPDAERPALISAIRAAGGIPTEERILELYKHHLIIQPTQTEIPRPLEPPMLGTPGGTATPASGRPPAYPPSVLRVPAAPRVIGNPEPVILGQTPMLSPTEQLRRLVLPSAPASVPQRAAEGTFGGATEDGRSLWRDAPSVFGGPESKNVEDRRKTGDPGSVTYTFGGTQTSVPRTEELTVPSQAEMEDRIAAERGPEDVKRLAKERRQTKEERDRDKKERDLSRQTR